MSVPEGAAVVGNSVIRDAATVILLRDSPTGLQTWMLIRTSRMDFAAGASVFPGGGVEEIDAELPFADGAGARLAARFGVPESTALALAGAAIRETYEETGILFATPSRPEIDLADARADVEEGRIAFGDLLNEYGLVLDDTALQPWSRWIGPPQAARRYDARFLVALVPEDQQPADVTFESSSAAWVSVADTVELACSGKLEVLWPTLLTLQQINAYSSVAAVLEATQSRRLDEPVRPTYGTRGELVTGRLPDGTYIEKRMTPQP